MHVVIICGIIFSILAPARLEEKINPQGALEEPPAEFSIVTKNDIFDLDMCALHLPRLPTNSPLSGYGTASENQESKPAVSDRKIYIVRHGERVDITFGPWVEHSFDEAGNYLRKDLNMPKRLPHRKNYQHWQHDSPLTNMGRYQAFLTGDAMRDAGVQIDYVYSSPSFRCIQTAASILDGLGLADTHSIHIEPGMFEFLEWYPEGVPNWLTVDELRAADYNVSPSYKPILSLDELKTSLEENVEQFYQRHSAVTEKLIEGTTGNILIVAHGINLDTCTRKATAKKLRPVGEICQLMEKSSFCSMVVMASANGKSDWKLVEPPCDPITHTNNERFDWKIFV